MDLYRELELLVADARAHGCSSVDCAALERVLTYHRRDHGSDRMQVYPLE